MVVCHVRSPTVWGQAPTGPVNRAKGLLDALHDDRRSGPKYRHLGARPPLEDDDPDHVSGLAVEVVPGDLRTDYQLGGSLSIAGELIAEVPIAAEAPNDIAGTPGEKARIAADRLLYGRAVREAFASCRVTDDRQPTALVVRHRPQRDEDNTWNTWVGAVCGVRVSRGEHWTAGAPLTGWVPTAVASLADTSLPEPITYELRGWRKTTGPSPAQRGGHVSQTVRCQR
jgi:hypothetical protein